MSPSGVMSSGSEKGCHIKPKPDSAQSLPRASTEGEFRRTRASALTTAVEDPRGTSRLVTVLLSMIPFAVSRRREGAVRSTMLPLISFGLRRCTPAPESRARL